MKSVIPPDEYSFGRANRRPGGHGSAYPADLPGVGRKLGDGKEGLVRESLNHGDEDNPAEKIPLQSRSKSTAEATDGGCTADELARTETALVNITM